jgi:hypothetical protein
MLLSPLGGQYKLIGLLQNYDTEKPENSRERINILSMSHCLEYLKNTSSTILEIKDKINSSE